MTDFNALRAPWSDEQVDALNRFQRRGDVHPFTCPNHSEMRDIDRALFATVNGWICAHCDYRQDWAHEAMVSGPVLESYYKLPCDVALPPATIIRKGCGLDVLMTAINERAERPAEECRFGDPSRHIPEAITGQAWRPGEPVAVHVEGGDYAYDGILRGIAVKMSGAIRYVVEDSNRRLFIHNARQLGVSEGWLPS